ncbi:hypothetical protein Pla52o_52860 [Novipirellula galeiformis]|uniref:Bacterial Ig-like domain (Group 2) n=1 Tax=Novipirellula galeiformis TaxID=2528004 RepID=A0A5C6BY55_9BACT|nr:DUF1549 and DUF1553 domain-containing protein [Novipirellula galeiformis]TWU17280.1 hypothetical protein Pla52o_52860 [Novipirellula galeiformis]
MRFDIHCRVSAHARRILVCLFLSVSVGLHASESESTISFVNDIAPVLTKAGCNTGVCHAKAGGGQNGFQLSLLGFEPLEDYEHTALEGRGRRLSPASPDQSLLLQKASGQTPHGGGIRLEPDSEGYAVMRRWIAQGAPLGPEQEIQLVSVEVQPAEGLLQCNSEQSLKVIAHYSDDSVRDVTKLALYESNDRAMVEVSEGGLVKALDLPGRAAVMVRYQGQVSVYSASIPLGAEVAELPTPNNFIDERVFANLQELGIPPSPLCDDATFLRRVSLDIAGRLPSVAETEAFLANPDDDRRDQVIDSLLRSPEYADYFANKWTTLLKNRRDDRSDITSNFAFHAWLRDSLLANRPYDQITRELLAATGTVIANPAVAWYKRVKEPNAQLEDVAQLFLGVRMQCAQCHHHPFERWSQDDYYGLAAFFSQVGRKPTAVPGEDLIFHQRGMAGSKNIKTGQTIPPAALGDDVGVISADEDPRLKLADWMAAEQNPFFAKALVNRYWKHFLSRGLIEPEDDIRDTNPPTNPLLLEALERHFVESGYDLKELVRVITSSRAYQLSAAPNDQNLVDRQNYSRFYPKRLQAEVLLDSIDNLAGSRTDFANLPAGTRAVALPDNSYNKSSPFLKVFGRPESSSVCECERVQSASLGQSLHLLNAADIKSKLAFAGGRADRFVKTEIAPEAQVRELYLAAFSRPPRADELATAIAYLAEPRTDAEGKPLDAARVARENLHDLLWALMNTKEFLFNH